VEKLALIAAAIGTVFWASTASAGWWDSSGFYHPTVIGSQMTNNSQRLRKKTAMQIRSGVKPAVRTRRPPTSVIRR
jgi:hypothetical protein